MAASIVQSIDARRYLLLIGRDAKIPSLLEILAEPYLCIYPAKA